MAARDRIFGWLYVSPLLLVLVPFFVAPLLVVIAASFLQSDGFGGIIVNPTLQNYVDIFSSGLTFNLSAAVLVGSNDYSNGLCSHSISPSQPASLTSTFPAAAA